VEHIKVAVVKDWLTSYGGSEEQLVQVLKIFPKADIYTSVYDKERLPQLKDFKIRTPKLPKIFSHGRKFEYLVPFLPLHFSLLKLDGYDLVISITSGFAKGVKTGKTPHICICNTPIRFAWSLGGDQRGLISKILSPYFRWYDLWSAKRVDYFYANSKNVAKRIKNIYKRDSDVLYPPVRTNLYQPSRAEKEDYYITFSRLVPYKRVDLIVKAFTKMNKRLIVVGEGPQLGQLRQMSGPTIEFKGFLSEKKLNKLINHAKAFIFAADEDFGISPVEAMAAGCPVIAFKGGGAKETVTNKTGIFFSRQTVNSLIDTVALFETKKFKQQDLVKQAAKFSTEKFQQELIKIVRRHT